MSQQQEEQQKKPHAYDLYSDAEWKAVQARSASFTEQATAMLKEDPGIPIFLGCTCFALCAGLRQSFVKNDPSKANFYMGIRVMSQACAGLAVGWSLLKVATKDEAKYTEINNKLKDQQHHDANANAL